MVTHPSEYLLQAEVIHSEDAVNVAIASIAAQLNQYYLNQDQTNGPPIVLCVMGGAVYFTGQLLPKLSFAMQFDYVQATRYLDKTTGGALQWLVRPKQIVNNRNVLIIDDILDEGITLKAIVDECARLGARNIHTTVLVEKKINHSKPIQADYVGLMVPDRYVFGCGMDVEGWWRNLPAIYALAN
jgi:hypoxanthine phosphoribosyltransferase